MTTVFREVIEEGRTDQQQVQLSGLSRSTLLPPNRKKVSRTTDDTMQDEKDQEDSDSDEEQDKTTSSTAEHRQSSKHVTILKVHDAFQSKATEEDTKDDQEELILSGIGHGATIAKDIRKKPQKLGSLGVSKVDSEEELDAELLKLSDQSTPSSQGSPRKIQQRKHWKASSRDSSNSSRNNHFGNMDRVGPPNDASPQLRKFEEYLRSQTPNMPSSLIKTRSPHYRMGWGHNDHAYMAALLRHSSSGNLSNMADDFLDTRDQLEQSPVISRKLARKSSSGDLFTWLHKEEEELRLMGRFATMPDLLGRESPAVQLTDADVKSLKPMTINESVTKYYEIHRSKGSGSFGQVSVGILKSSFQGKSSKKKSSSASDLNEVIDIRRTSKGGMMKSPDFGNLSAHSSAQILDEELELGKEDFLQRQQSSYEDEEDDEEEEPYEKALEDNSDEEALEDDSDKVSDKSGYANLSQEALRLTQIQVTYKRPPISPSHLSVQNDDTNAIINPNPLSPLGYNMFGIASSQYATGDSTLQVSTTTTSSSNQLAPIGGRPLGPILSAVLEVDEDAMSIVSHSPEVTRVSSIESAIVGNSPKKTSVQRLGSSKGLDTIDSNMSSLQGEHLISTPERRSEHEKTDDDSEVTTTPLSLLEKRIVIPPKKDTVSSANCIQMTVAFDQLTVSIPSSSSKNSVSSDSSYAKFDPSDKRKRMVALKRVVFTQHWTAEDALREIEALSRVRGHENVVEYYDAFMPNNHELWFSMELANMGTLAHVIDKRAEDRKRNNRDPLFDEETIAKFAKQLWSALAHIHKNNVIHFDIKSTNILLIKDDQLKICDFGMALFMDPKSRTVPGKRLRGTANYIAPEVAALQDTYTEKADVWSASVTLMETNSGRIPFAHVGDQVRIIKYLKDIIFKSKDDHFSQYSRGGQVGQYPWWAFMMMDSMKILPENRLSAQELLDKYFPGDVIIPHVDQSELVVVRRSDASTDILRGSSSKLTITSNSAPTPRSSRKITGSPGNLQEILQAYHQQELGNDGDFVGEQQQQQKVTVVKSTKCGCIVS